jgi:hypothetical protein
MLKGHFANVPVHIGNLPLLERLLLCGKSVLRMSGGHSVFLISWLINIVLSLCGERVFAVG